MPAVICYPHLIYIFPGFFSLKFLQWNPRVGVSALSRAAAVRGGRARGASNGTYSGLNLRLHIAMIIAVLFLERKKKPTNLMLLL